MVSLDRYSGGMTSRNLQKWDKRLRSYQRGPLWGKPNPHKMVLLEEHDVREIRWLLRRAAARINQLEHREKLRSQRAEPIYDGPIGEFFEDE